jgi:hypothetical protein
VSAVPAQDDGKKDSRRGGPRQRVLLAGKIVFDNGARSFDCTIRDLTETGAKVKMEGADLLPSTVFLIDMKRGLGIESRVAWIRPPEAGLAFLKSHDLRNPSEDPTTRTMHRLWLERMAR